MPIVIHQDQKIFYALKRTRRRRSIALRIDPSGAVTVLAPRLAVGYFIERFVQERAEWIAEKLKAFEASRMDHPPKAFSNGETFPVWGAEVPLKILHLPSVSTPACEMAEGVLKISIKDSSEEESRDQVKEVLREWYARQTEYRLQESLPLLATSMAVAPIKVKVANQRKRWGSCSRQGYLRFNWRLSMMPPAILDYVMVHELAHLKAPDHSRRFWAIVQSTLPDFKERRTWLRKNGVHLDFLN